MPAAGRALPGSGRAGEAAAAWAEAAAGFGSNGRGEWCQLHEHSFHTVVSAMKNNAVLQGLARQHTSDEYHLVPGHRKATLKR